MKPRHWKIRRQCIDAADAQRRWDRAYQCLLQWGSNPGETKHQQDVMLVHETYRGEKR